MLHNAMLLSAGVMVGAIDLSLVPEQNVVNVGDTVRVGLYASSDDSSDQYFSGIEAIFAWDASQLAFLGTDQAGAVPLLSSWLPDDPYGLNESDPPADGDGFYTALAPLGDVGTATPGGSLITTFEFEATTPGTNVPLDLLPEAGMPAGETVVFADEPPNTDVTGILTGTSVTILVPTPAGLVVLACGVCARRRRRRA